MKLNDYRETNYEIPEIELYFNIFDDYCLVTSQLKLVARKSKLQNEQFFYGEELELLELELNGSPLEIQSLKRNKEGLILDQLLEENTVKFVTKIYPHKNTSLSGLYKSGEFYCSQNEAEGFRRITYFIDRPDILSSYKVWIEADKAKFPFLLSNGDKKDSLDLENSRHKCLWVDPFKKPCYLFALVAGDFHKRVDKFITRSNKEISLEFFVEHKYKDRIDYAMKALKQSMKWDEDRFGLEYDLNTYMIVATDDFNSGAMENKGLNIFNTKYVLSSPETATEDNYYLIQSVIGHEYFHNWTGNRITCRDWFQLSLKEGLTVFRDQEFTSDLNSRAVKRIEDVSALRSAQFPEDAGPNAHPVRPSEVGSIDNFYSATIYEKGAELIRMIHCLIGEKKFQAGMRLYFQKFDGMAVRCEDFVDCMAEASGKKLDTFFRWYTQKGTPKVNLIEHWDEKNKVLKIDFQQEDSSKELRPIPIKVAFFSDSGEKLKFSHPLLQETENEAEYLIVLESNHLNIELKAQKLFSGSYLRSFSAPIHLEIKERALPASFFAKKDDDLFNQYEAIQGLYQDYFFALYENKESKLPSSLQEAMEYCFSLESKDPAFVRLAMKTPAAAYLILSRDHFDFDRFDEAYKALNHNTSLAFESHFQDSYQRHYQTYSQKNGLEFKGQKEWMNHCLHRLCSLNYEKYKAQAFEQFQSANNMSSQQGALESLILNQHSKECQSAISDFTKKWSSDRLVVTKLFQILCASKELALSNYKEILDKDFYENKNPNHIYASLASLLRNLSFLHRDYKNNYTFVLDKIAEIDHFNPQVASRMAGAFENYDKFDPDRKAYAKDLWKQLGQKNISKNLQEIVKNNLV